MKNKFILFLTLLIFTATIPTETDSVVLPVVAYVIGEKITTAIIIKTAAFLALFGYAVYKSRKEKPEEGTQEVMDEFDTKFKTPINGGGGGGGGDEKPPKKTKPANSVLQNIAKFLGFFKTGKIRHGQTVFKKGNTEISYDHTDHNGGFWKKFIRDERVGTYDVHLIKKIKD